jgi:hypothetical protein
MGNDTLDYAAFVDDAMRGVVREILRQVERSGLPGPHHFFISLSTEHPGVMMSDTLRSRYPQEITIVLQHQFWDLHVEENSFRIALSFNNIPEKLVIPFAALTGFADPSTKFGLQFHNQQPAQPVAAPAALPVAQPASDDFKESAKVIALDAFRKK